MAGRQMIQSMTGYGRATKRTRLGTIIVELRSTNHRYLEIDQRLPNGFAAVQQRLAETLRTVLHRGRVELSVTIHHGSKVAGTGTQAKHVVFDEALLRKHYEALLQLKARLGIPGPVTLDQVLALPQAVTVAEERIVPEELWESVHPVFEEATKTLVRHRCSEGTRLIRDLRHQAQLIERHLQQIHRQLPKAAAQQRQRLRQRLLALLGPEGSTTGSRLEEALALVKEADIHEELVRIRSHLEHIRQTFEGAALVGKQLDFIAQELTREANTMGAKVNDPHAARVVVTIKGCVEKIREQAQNLE